MTDLCQYQASFLLAGLDAGDKFCVEKSLDCAAAADMNYIYELSDPLSETAFYTLHFTNFQLPVLSKH